MGQVDPEMDGHVIDLSQRRVYVRPPQETIERERGMLLDSPAPQPNTLSMEGRTKLAYRLWFAVIWGWTAWFVARYAYSLYDDAYIYLRYADNVLAGCGLRFNCADVPVEGFTSPLYMAITVLGGALGADLEIFVQLFGLFTLAAATSIVYAVVVKRALEVTRPFHALCIGIGTSAALLASPNFLLNSVIGLETSLACLVLTFLLWSASRPDLPYLRTLLVLAFVTRPESALFTLALPLTKQGRSLRYLLPLGLALGAIQLARVLTFGEFFPNTFYAKSGGTLNHLVLGLEYIGMIVYDFPYVLLGLGALAWTPLRKQTSWAWVAIGVWLLFFLKSGGDAFEYSRLAVPLVPGILMLGVTGLLPRLARIQSSQFQLGLVLVITLGFIGWAQSTQAFVESEGKGFQNVEQYTHVGRFLGKEHPGSLVATVPIGAIGYFSTSEIIDLVGLTRPEVAKAKRSVPPELMNRRWIAHERHNTEYVLDRKPELFITTRFRTDRPWANLEETRASVYAEWLFLRAIKEGKAPYRVYSPDGAPGLYWLMFQRIDES